jgi:hypothetical protein
MRAGGTLYLIRVVVGVAPNYESVVTVYRMSKIEKYCGKTHKADPSYTLAPDWRSRVG